jgi:hypothetical protein
MNKSDRQFRFHPRQTEATPTRFRRWSRIYWTLMFAGATLAAAQNGPQNSGNTPSSQDAGAGRGWVVSPKIVIPEPQAGQPNFDAANAERRKQIADDSAKLLKMATDLKAEVDKTTKDTLSLNVIRKADEIEKLAHAVKEKMKLTAEAR